MRTLHNLLRGIGRRRAADYIPVVEADRDEWKARCAALEARLGHADDLLVALCCRNTRLERDLREARTDRDLLANAHLITIAENDELAHRLIEARAEISNLRAISSPAPADCGPAIPLPPVMGEPTSELPVSTLWNAHGLRAAA